MKNSNVAKAQNTDTVVAKAKNLNFLRMEDNKLFYTVNAGKTEWWRNLKDGQTEFRHYTHMFTLDTKAKSITMLRPFDPEVDAPKTVAKTSTLPTTKSGKPNKAIKQVSEFDKRVEAGLSNRLDGVDYQAKMVDGILTKICLCCNKPQEVTMFSNLKKSKDGKLNNCKTCEIRRKAK